MLRCFFFIFRRAVDSDADIEARRPQEADPKGIDRDRPNGPKRRQHAAHPTPTAGLQRMQHHTVVREIRAMTPDMGLDALLHQPLGKSVAVPLGPAMGRLGSDHQRHRSLSEGGEIEVMKEKTLDEILADRHQQALRTGRIISVVSHAESSVLLVHLFI